MGTTKMSRRGFVTSAAVGAATAAMGSIAAVQAEETRSDAPGGLTEPEGGTEEGITCGVRPQVNGRRTPTAPNCGKIGPNAQPIAPVEPPAEWDESYDAVVVGSGYGGLCAAVRMLQNGLKVCLLEKDPWTGGTSAHSSWNVIITGGSKAQNEMGYHWIPDVQEFDPKKLANYYQQYAQYSVDNNLLIAVIENGAKWADWMMEVPYIDWVCCGSFYRNRVLMDGSRNEVLGNKPTTDALERNIYDLGGELKLRTAASNLVYDGEKVMGVKATGPDGEIYIEGKYGVVLTAGGFGMNLDMLEQYIPDAYQSCTQGGPMPSDTGECTRMALGLGADMSGLNSHSDWPGGLDDYWGDGDGMYWHYFWNGARMTALNPWLLLDRNCDRVPWYVKGFDTPVSAQAGFIDNTFGVGYLACSTAYETAPGHRGIAIWDADYENSLRKFEQCIGCPVGSPIFDPDLLPEGALNYVSDDWKGDIEAAVKRGAIKRADTLEELGELLGLDPEKFVAAVNRWNEQCENGVDEDLPMPYSPEWLIPLQNPPYYGTPISGIISKTMCGVRVNPKLEVIDVEGKVISGLYAGFWTAGGLCGENNINGLVGHPSVLCAVAASGCGGYMAANSILGKAGIEVAQG